MERNLHTYIRKHPAEGVASYKRQAKQISGYAANVVYCHRERTYRYENIDQKHVNAGYRGGYHAVLRPVADPYGTVDYPFYRICKFHSSSSDPKFGVIPPLQNGGIIRRILYLLYIVRIKMSTSANGSSWKSVLLIK
jgi:hypothetical protein